MVLKVGTSRQKQFWDHLPTPSAVKVLFLLSYIHCVVLQSELACGKRQFNRNTEGCFFSWFCRSVLVESCSVWTMKREELREVKGRHRWLTLLLTCWFLTHLPSKFTHPCLSLAPDFVSIMIVTLKGNFPSEIFRYFLLCFGRILTLYFFSCPCCVMMWCRTRSRKLSQCCC